MKTIEWSNELETGHILIDHQHRILVLTMNSLAKVYEARHERSAEVVNNCLDRLVEYADYHFETEEMIMRKAGYKETIFHTQMHDKFKTHLVQYYKQHSAGEDIVETLVGFLSDWLEDHIKGADANMVREIALMVSGG